MRILLLEPFLEGSHREWVNGLVRYSSHNMEVMSLPGRHWKWRMHGAAPHFASLLAGQTEKFDLIVATDFLDLSAFLGISRKFSSGIPTVLYFHENQLAYPWSPKDPDIAMQRDRHYAFINITSALAADSVLFSTHYQKNSFLKELPGYLKAFPDFRLDESPEIIGMKSSVVPPGVELPDLSAVFPEDAPKTDRSPVIVWNHRWEFDKGPDLFFKTLYLLKEKEIPFRLVVLGKAYGKVPPVFEEAKNRLHDRILHWGYCDRRADYYHWLRQSDIAAVTNYQDFFGMSVIEAAWMGCTLLLPHRLAYPEIFGEHAQWYENDGEFIGAVEHMLVNYKRRQTSPVLRENLNKYRWESCIREYDAHFGSLISG